MTDEDMLSAGIGGGLLRMSVGYTGTVAQRWQQLESALMDIGAVQAPLAEAV
jgi:methionine-gamma-lyase